MKRVFSQMCLQRGRKGRERGEDGVQERERDGKNRYKGKQRMRGIFWNVAGVRKKEEDFWEFLREFEVVGLTETWVDEAG